MSQNITWKFAQANVPNNFTSMLPISILTKFSVNKAMELNEFEHWGT